MANAMYKPVLFLLALLFMNFLFAQWQPTSGPQTPRGLMIRTAVLKGDTIIVGTHGKGMYRSGDNGANWEAAHSGLPGGSGSYIYSLALFGDTVLTGTHKGVFLSTSYGTNWAAANAGLPANLTVHTIVLKDSFLFIGTDDGVFHSPQQGIQWTEVNSGLPQNYYGDYTPVEALLNFNGYLFAGTYAGVYRSTDNGVSWTPANTGIPPNPPPYPRVPALAAKGADLYAGTNYGGGIYRSTDNGNNWFAVSNGLPPSGLGNVLPIWAIGVFNNDLYAGMDVGVYRSTDNGANWNEFNTGLPSPYIFIFDFAVQEDDLFAATDNGLFRLDQDLMNWELAFQSFPENISVYSLGQFGGNLFTSGFGYQVYSASNFVFHSPDNGNTWLPAADSTITNAAISSFVQSGGNFYAAGSGVYLSTDGGLTWAQIDSGLPWYPINSLLPDGNFLFAGAGIYAAQTIYGGVFLSTNNGTSWSAAGLEGKYIHSLVKKENYLFAGFGHIGFGIPEGGVYRSTDNGATWIAVNSGFPSFIIVNSLLVKELHLFAGTSKGVYVSTDNGENWAAMNAGLPPNLFVNILISYGEHLFAGTESGVFHSSDNGANWIAINDGLIGGALKVKALIISSDYILAGTGNGVWRLLPDLVSIPVAAETEIPFAVLVEQNYPNPFNPTTQIRFGLPAPARVKVEIFNLLGQRVYVEETQQLPAGYHLFEWNGQSAAGQEVSSGIYFYKISDGKNTAVRKMILLR